MPEMPKRGPGRPRDPNAKRQVSYRLSPDVIAAIAASDKTVDALLREKLLGLESAEA